MDRSSVLFSFFFFFFAGCEQDSALTSFCHYQSILFYIYMRQNADHCSRYQELQSFKKVINRILKEYFEVSSGRSGDVLENFLGRYNNMNDY